MSCAVQKAPEDNLQLCGSELAVFLEKFNEACEENTVHEVGWLKLLFIPIELIVKVLLVRAVSLVSSISLPLSLYSSRYLPRSSRNMASQPVLNPLQNIH